MFSATLYLLLYCTVQLWNVGTELTLKIAIIYCIVSKPYIFLPRSVIQEGRLNGKKDHSCHR